MTLRLTLTLLIATLLMPVRSYGLFGLGSPARDLAWLWIPAEDFSAWERLAVLMEADQDIKLTVALSPPMMTPAMREATASLVAEGRLEVALRLQGDPILPLIQRLPGAPRPQDPLKRIAIARERYRQVFGGYPEGFVPGAGLIAPDLLRAFKAMHLRWVAVGGESADPWPSNQQTVFVQARPLRSSGPLAPGDVPDPERSLLAYVADESQGLLPAGALLDFLDSNRGAKTPWKWRTVSAVVSARAASPEDRRARSAQEVRSDRGEAGPDAAAVSHWSDWTGEDYEAWLDLPSLRDAWKLYAGAAQALTRYRNSGTANLKVLESATDDLYKTQSSRFYRILSGSTGSEQARETEEEFRALLISVYQRLRKPPPEGLFESLVPENSDEGPAHLASRSGRLRVAKGPAWISFENPKASLASGARWRIDTVRLDWDETDIVFTYRMGELEAPDGENLPGTKPMKDPALGRTGDGSPHPGLLLQTYIDLNHVVGAGSTQLLAGRGLFLAAPDAWEYALSVTLSGAALYRWAGRNLEAARTQPEVDPESREIRVRFPRKELRGNPLRWGYITISLTSSLEEEDDDAQVVGIVGPLNVQRSIAKPSQAMKRLGALRVDNGTGASD